MKPLTIANMPFSPTRSEGVLAALEEYELPLVRYALRFLGDEASARDAVQYAFLKLIAYQESETEPDFLAQPAEWPNGKLAAWLFAVVRNRSTDLLRERGRTGPLHEKCQCELPGESSDDPALHVEREELLAMVRRLIAELPL